MDAATLTELAGLMRGQRMASLGTHYRGMPLVSLVAYAPAPDAGSFCIHISRLAQHTQAILGDPRVGLMIAEQDDGTRNPQALARLSMVGKAIALDPAGHEYEPARAAYLGKHPSAALNFTLQDFALYRIVPDSARYVAGFGRIFDVAPADLRQAASLR